MARKLLEPFSDQLVWIKKYSSSAIAEIIELVDFVYINGNHQQEYVAEDISNYRPLIRMGGVIGGHDFYNGFQQERNGVISAVMSMASEKSLNLRIELPDWWAENSINKAYVGMNKKKYSGEVS